MMLFTTLEKYRRGGSVYIYLGERNVFYQSWVQAYQVHFVFVYKIELKHV